MNASAEIHRFNDVASRIWELCETDKGRSHEELVELLSEEYDVDRDTLSRDVATFLEHALEKSLLQTLA